MASYTTPDLNDYLPGEPLTSAKALLMVENPIAIAEGGTNAPYVQNAWHPYNGTHWTDGNDGTFYDATVDTNSDEVESPDFVSGYEYRVYLNDCQRTSGVGSSVILVDIFVGSYGEAVASTLQFSTSETLSMVLDLPTSWRSTQRHIATLEGIQAQASGPPTGEERVVGGRVFPTAGPVEKVRIRTNGTFSFGGITNFQLFRRRVV